MNRGATRTIRNFLAAAVLLALAPAAHASILFVANNGVDISNNGVPGAGCGPSGAPCRSITQAIANAFAGDQIIVGPGVYDNATETPAPGCACMLAVNKAVTIVSSEGAAATVIDGRGSSQPQNVLIITDGPAQFGKPGKGFTVTSTGASGLSKGIVIDSTNVKIRGNQVVGTPFGSASPDVGIYTVGETPGPVLIRGNQVIGWGSTGILVHGPGNTVQQNVSVLSNNGILADGNSRIVGNVVIGNQAGIVSSDVATVTGNSALGNYADGLQISGSSNFLQDNNIFGNGICGLENDGVAGLLGANNYWGALTGPGPDPADEVCDDAGGKTLLAPIATVPFPVNAPIKPSPIACP